MLVANKVLKACKNILITSFVILCSSFRLENFTSAHFRSKQQKSMSARPGRASLAVLSIVSAAVFLQPALARSQSQDSPNCEKLTDLYIEIGKRSGEPVTREQAHAAVYDADPSDSECAMMVKMFKERGYDG